MTNTVACDKKKKTVKRRLETAVGFGFGNQFCSLTKLNRSTCCENCTTLLCICSVLCSTQTACEAGVCRSDAFFFFALIVCCKIKKSDMTIYIGCAMKLECSKIFRIFLHNPEQGGNIHKGNQGLCLFQIQILFTSQWIKAFSQNNFPN